MLEMIAMLAVLQEPAGPAPESLEQVRTRTAHTLKREELEVELVFSHLDIGEEDVEVSRGAVEIEYGITPSIMAELEIVYLDIDPDGGPGERGWGDFEIELKHRLPWTPEEVVLAVGAEVSLLTGDEDEGLGDRDTEFGIFGAASRSFGLLSVHSTFGVEVQEEEKPEYETALALMWTPWGNSISLLLAVNGEIESDESEWTLVPGVEVSFEEEGGEEEEEIEIQAGLGIPIGLSEEAEDWGIIVTLEFEF